MSEQGGSERAGRNEVSPHQLDLGGAQIIIRAAAVDELIDLRHQVLRHGLPRASAHFEGDHNPGALHFGAFDQAEAVACVSLLPSTLDGVPAWHLRGMATAPRFRGKGLGRHLMQFVERELCSASPIRLAWCNARGPSVGFYQGMGWRVISGEFEIPTAGPHVRMRREL